MLMIRNRCRISGQRDRVCTTLRIPAGERAVLVSRVRPDRLMTTSPARPTNPTLPRDSDHGAADDALRIGNRRGRMRGRVRPPVVERTVSVDILGTLPSCGRMRSRASRPSAPGLRLALTALAALCVWASATPAFGRDPSTLLDLTVPAARVPDWLALDDLPLDTSGWTLLPMNAVDCADSSVSDRDALASAIASAPARTVLQLNGGGCIYNVESDIQIQRSDIVVRGAGIDQTVILMRGRTQAFVVNSAGFDSARQWTGGYRMGERILTLASTTGLAVGDYVRMSASLPSGAVARQNEHSFISKIESVTSSRITLDVGLPTNFDSTNQIVERFRPHRHIGLEDMTMRHASPSTDMAYRYFVILSGVADSWVAGVRFTGVWSHAVLVRSAARVLIQSNLFSDQLKPDPWNKGALRLMEDTSTNQVERNIFQNTEVSIELEYGANHNVIAYNYVADPDGPCERGLFLHNDYASANLFEGNDIACPAQWDDLSGSSGPYNTFFRNRLRAGAQMLTGQYEGRLGGEYHAGREHLSYNIVANHVKDLAGGPQPDQHVDSFGRDFWIERNVYTSHCSLSQPSGAVAPECASGFPPFAINTTWASNHRGAAAPASWSNIRIPASLYRTQPPAWWCQESGTFPNIGAPSDDASGGPGGYPRLPAQRWAEGLPCSTSTSELPPLAPILLQN